MIETYKIECKCHRMLVVQVESSCPFLRIYCHACNSLVLEYHPKEGGKISPTGRHPKEILEQAAIPIEDRGRLSAPHEEQKANKFASYLILKMLGSGSTGKVYLAVDEKNREKVALKVLQKTDNPKVIDYFMREAQVLLQLNHPNIVRLKGRGNYNGFAYIAMEYIEGKNLEDILKQHPLSPIDAARIGYHILLALEHASQYQIIHRDIKPSNVYLTTSGEIKLIDMGISKSLDDPGDLTKTGQSLGTPYYMPLEQILDAKRADHRSDIYAVGATLYHTLCGVPPYNKFKNNLQGLLRAKMNHTYTPLTQLASHLPSEIVMITEKAMAHSPEERYSSARDMKEALQNFLKNAQQAH